MIKFIASDMDGTLLGRNNDIPEENLKAIRKAEEKGVQFVIASGRMYEDIKPFLDRYNLKCECIVLNGAEYRDKDGNILEGIYMDKGKLKNILEIIKRDGLNVEIYTDIGLYTTNTKEESLKGSILRVQYFHPEVTNHEEILKRAKEEHHFTILKYIDNIDEFLSIDIKIGKIESYDECEDKIFKLKEELETIEGLAIASSVAINLEINHIEAQKGIILSKVSNKKRVKKDEVVVIGDGFNDYSMFSEFPISFAMENAIPEIKEIAKYITDTNYNSGVAKAINKVLQEY
jgi:Cof subfamily protein (haloacid dehalogenase superfamily)